jgi:hypothetical protein
VEEEAGEMLGGFPWKKVEDSIPVEGPSIPRVDVVEICEVPIDLRDIVVARDVATKNSKNKI